MLARVKYKMFYTRKEVEDLLSHVKHKTAMELKDINRPKSIKEIKQDGDLLYTMLHGQVKIVRQPACSWDALTFGRSAGALKIVEG